MDTYIQTKGIIKMDLIEETNKWAKNYRGKQTWKHKEVKINSVT